MLWTALYDKIGKLPVAITGHKQVVAVIERDGKKVVIPLELKLDTNSNQKIWFVEKKREQKPPLKDI